MYKLSKRAEKLPIGAEVFSPQECKDIILQIKEDPQKFILDATQNQDKVSADEIFQALKAWKIS